MLLTLLHKKPEYLVLCSCGGDMGVMCACIDYLRNIRVRILATGSCYSAAVPIVGMGSPRSATRLTRFLVHPGRVALEADRTVSDIRNEHTELQRLEDIYVRVLAECTRESAAWWQKRVDESWAFGVKDALKVGLVDEIV